MKPSHQLLCFASLEHRLRKMEHMSIAEGIRDFTCQQLQLHIPPFTNLHITHNKTLFSVALFLAIFKTSFLTLDFEKYTKLWPLSKAYPVVWKQGRQCRAKCQKKFIEPIKIFFHHKTNYSDSKYSVESVSGKYLENGWSDQHGDFSVELVIEKLTTLFFCT